MFTSQLFLSLVSILYNTYGRAKKYTMLFLKKTFYFGVFPDFIILGTQKSGTRFLQEYLEKHPNVKMAKRYNYKRGKFKLRNEMHFFDINYEKGLKWYLSHFAISPLEYYRKLKGKKILFGEKTPDYICIPWLPQHLVSIFPNIKLLILLRNPVDRTYSQYRMLVRQKQENRNFEKIVSDAFEELNQEKDYENTYPWTNILARGIYVFQVKKYLDCFPPSQLKIIKSEDMFEDPSKIYEEVLEFLDLPEWKPDFFVNRKERTYEPMSPQTQKFLGEFFQPYNEMLYELLDRNFAWDE